MEKIGFIRKVTGLVFDIDNTIYTNPEYIAQGTINEIEEVGKILGITEIAKAISKRRKEIAQKKVDRKATMTETVFSLGITKQQWSDLRFKAWRPEEWLDADPEVARLIVELSKEFTVSFGTNSPKRVGEKICRLIGIPEHVVPSSRIFGPENLGTNKPDPNFFRGISSRIDIKAEELISVGDRRFSDGPPALEANYCGAIIIPGGRDEFVDACEMLLKKHL